ncbi:LysE family translocator [Nonomuraea africana]|uniref:Threonine/homoserine/homoserine lactone efflux protein n=1 Tax=Nonomuraea africana TaxID=46171 RepID=A0ABR9KAI4_9ACTN|nr:LysE family translocator [Nonomuraea africana]MBE1558999.1 threonine/homoserine/homoserine lactone efflux protein [Nonomuraea africana]
MLIDPGVAATFCLAALVMALVPGPDLLFITATGLASGPRAGVLAALGMSAGLAVHTTAAAFGLGALLQTFPTAFTVVRILGAVYLVYLAVGSFLAAARKDDADPARARAEQELSARRVFGRALLTNLANPKVIAFYLAFFPQFVDPARGHVMAQFFVLGALFILIGLSVDASAGLLAGRLGDFVRGRSSVQRWLHCLSGTVFGVLAVRLATDTR